MKCCQVQLILGAWVISSGCADRNDKESSVVGAAPTDRGSETAVTVNDTSAASGVDLKLGDGASIRAPALAKTVVYEGGSLPEQLPYLQVSTDPSGSMRWLQSLRAVLPRGPGMLEGASIEFGEAPGSGTDLFLSIDGTTYTASSGTVMIERATLDRVNLRLENVLLRGLIEGGGEHETEHEAIKASGTIDAEAMFECYVQGGQALGDSGSESGGAREMSEQSATPWTLAADRSSPTCAAVAAQLSEPTR